MLSFRWLSAHHVMNSICKVYMPHVTSDVNWFVCKVCAVSSAAHVSTDLLKLMSQMVTSAGAAWSQWMV